VFRDNKVPDGGRMPLLLIGVVASAGGESLRLRLFDVGVMALRLWSLLLGERCGADDHCCGWCCESQFNL
jgi:hypothetical protein